ncbi:MAG: DegT/DnrJ/EryC1/StrS family aminotransferase [Caldilineaceae bacterium]|nr:DegT/DnrJ/EryC1/StrS family aminotransferase [Caldilineaceae bacterium]
MGSDIYSELGVTPVVNAMGHVTVLGGSILSPAVQAAMDAANSMYVSMDELQDKAGRAIAKMLGAEAAFVTSGAFAALVLGAAGIMTGGDPAKIAQLPDTRGMKDEFLFQKATRYRYDRCITTAGAKLIEVGDEQGTTPGQLTAAIGPQTAGIFFFARGERIPGTLSLAQVVEIAQTAGLPVLVDAAGEVYPLERLTGLPQSGAGLVCYGAKYLSSANSTGILCGQAGLVAAARLNSFTGYESQNNRSIGRGYKVDRQEIAATAVALREWLETDHEERFQQQAARIETIARRLADLPHVTTRNLWPEEQGPWMRLHVAYPVERVGKNSQEIAVALKAGNPSIWVRPEGEGLTVEVHTLRPGEEQIVADALHRYLAG